MSRRQSCNYEGLNRWQRVSIESCILENKRLTRIITKKAPLKHSTKTVLFSRTLHKTSGKITTANCICNNYRTNNKQRFTRESVKIISFYSKVALTVHAHSIIPSRLSRGFRFRLFPHKELQSFFDDNIISISASQFFCLLVTVPDHSQVWMSIWMSSCKYNFFWKHAVFYCYQIKDESSYVCSNKNVLLNLQFLFYRLICFTYYFLLTLK